MLRNGRSVGALMVYDPKAEKAVPLSGTQLSLTAADLVVREIVSSVLMNEKMDRLWANWLKEKGKARFIDSNDPLLKEAKEQIASALHVDPKSVGISLSQIPGGRTAVLFLGSPPIAVVKFLAIPGSQGFELQGDPEVDLTTIGEKMSR